MPPLPFEALSAHWDVQLKDFPEEWVPLTYLYDPDLPLFPVLYFHALDPNLTPGTRPNFKDRVFGYIRHLNLEGGGARASVVLNKDLSLPANSKYIAVVEREVRSRLGLGDPITVSDITAGLTGSLAKGNHVMVELWHKVVASAFGNKLPFGRVWDPVMGLVRFIASWNSADGRKGELIQTHYFASVFGERIAAGSGVNIDFYLLPTFEELQDNSNPLGLFPAFSDLIGAAGKFCSQYCTLIDVGGQKFSAFNRSKALGGGKLNTKSIRALIAAEADPVRRALTENYNAFNRGPQRSIISLLMLHDLRKGNWNPLNLTSDISARLYTELRKSFQTPKVIQLYSQQCFGALTVLPIDIWVKTFLRWPLELLGKSNAKYYAKIFGSSAVWGKLERLIWVASQARKVHSSVASDILWCIRYGGQEKQMRGANPLSCKLCNSIIRAACPSFDAIKAAPVVFNAAAPAKGFSITSSAGNSTAPNQTYVCVSAPGLYDEYSPRDRPGAFLPYPQTSASSGVLTTEEFLKKF